MCDHSKIHQIIFFILSQLVDLNAVRCRKELKRSSGLREMLNKNKMNFFFCFLPILASSSGFDEGAVGRKVPASGEKEKREKRVGVGFQSRLFVDV
jgi:hypothetical protein